MPACRPNNPFLPLALEVILVVSAEPVLVAVTTQTVSDEYASITLDGHYTDSACL